jgi:hypothetical protein
MIVGFAREPRAPSLLALIASWDVLLLQYLIKIFYINTFIFSIPFLSIPIIAT